MTALRFLACALLSLSIYSKSVWADGWTNALKPAGESVPLTLVANGAARHQILLSANPTAPERRAAQDLQKWLRQCTDAEFTIIDSTKAANAEMRFISIGSTELLKQSSGSDTDLGDEGYEIRVHGENLLLRGGRTRGIINAVYTLLEEDLGCRWHTREGFSRPAGKLSGEINIVPRTYLPKLKLRDPYNHTAFEADWSLPNRTNAPSAAVPEEAGGRIDYGGLFVHTHATLLSQGEINEHPEYFAQNSAGNRYAAQLCPTHPDVARIVTQNVLSFLEKSPHTEIVSVSKNDNGGDQICHCPTCAKLRQDEGGSDAAPQLVLVNKVAEAVEKHYPNVVIDTLAYLETSGVPKTIRPRHNVAIRLCNDAPGAWSRPFTPARDCNIAKLATAWSAAHNRIYIWDYAVNFSHYLAPMPNLDVVADNIRFWLENNAEGIMIQGGYQGPAERDEMRSWIIAKLLWDPTRDLNALTRDFIHGHYGKAAGPIAAYDTLLNNLRTTHGSVFRDPPAGIRYPMEAAFFTKEFVDRASALFAEARKLAEGDEALTRRVERAELPVLYVKLSRGPGFSDGFGETLERFERIASRENLRHCAEGAADLDAKLAAWRKQANK